MGNLMTPDELDYLVNKGRHWVPEQRRFHRKDAVPLSRRERTAFEPFFEANLLDSARFKEVPVIHNPDFYRELEAAGHEIPLDFTVMQGITFQDTVLLSARYKPNGGWSLGLFFHELVHVAQYCLLGVDDFISRYVHGWAANGYMYEAIPLERDAYDLQDRYEQNPGQPFSVEQKVSGRLKPGI